VSDYEKLIVMLGSPNDGEVVAAARAIDRRLKSDGKDWHWFAESFAVVKPQSRLPRRFWQRPPVPPAPPVDECRSMLDELSFRHMNTKEMEFVRKTRAKMALFANLTEGQRRTIDELYRRYVSP